MQGFDAAKADDPYKAMFEPGAWREMIVTSQDDPEGHTVWHVTPPCGHPGQLVAPEDGQDGHHTVTRNPDGAITVDPSIWCQSGGDDHRQPCWHGHLRNGTWVSV